MCVAIVFSVDCHTTLRPDSHILLHLVENHLCHDIAQCIVFLLRCRLAVVFLGLEVGLAVPTLGIPSTANPLVGINSGESPSNGVQSYIRLAPSTCKTCANALLWANVVRIPRKCNQALPPANSNCCRIANMMSRRPTDVTNCSRH